MSLKPDLIVQKSELLYPNILFDLPQNPIHRPQIVIWGGQPNKLHYISDIYRAILGFGWPTDFLICAKLATYLPAGVEKIIYEEDKPGGLVKNSDDIVKSLSGKNFMIAGPDLAVNSNEQILAEKTIAGFAGEILITGEFFRIFKTSPSLYEKKNFVVFSSTPSLIKLANHLRLAVSIEKGVGVYNKINLLELLGGGKKKFIIFDDRQIIAYDSSNPNVAGIYNSQTNLIPHKPILLGICASLIAADKGKNHFVESVLTACYLLGRLVKEMKPSSVTSNEIRKLIGGLV